MELSELWPLVFVEVYLCSPKVYLSNFPSNFIGGSFPKLFDLINIKLDFITLNFIFVLMGQYITGGRVGIIHSHVLYLTRLSVHFADHFI